MANRSLGTLSVDVIVNDGSFAPGMDRVERRGVRTQANIEREARKSAQATERAWKQANANVEKQFSGLSEKQYNAAMRGVPAQITDIVVSLQGGQAPLTVLLQQGGQLKDMFGGVGAAAAALARGLAATINPITLVIGAVVALAAGLIKGRSEYQAFVVAVEATGGKAGVSASQLNDMAAALDRVDGVTRGGAAAALVTFATSAGVGADRLQGYTRTALEWEKATGIAVDKTAEKFKKLAEDPVKGLVELNKEMGFLTSATYEQVKALVESGKSTEAVKVAQDAYDRAVAEATPRITQNLGYVERAWGAIKGLTADVLDGIAAVGRGTGVATELAQTASRIAELQSKGVQLTNTPSNYAERDLLNLKNKEIQLQKNMSAERAALEVATKARKGEELRIALSEEATKYADKETKKRQELAAAEVKYGELAKTNAQAAKQYAAVRAGIEEKYKPAAASTRKTETQKEADAAKQFLIQMEERARKVEDLTAYEQLYQEVQNRGLKLTEAQLSRAQGLATAIDMVREKRELDAAQITRNNALFELENRLLEKKASYETQLNANGVSDREALILRERIALQKEYGAEIGRIENDRANAIIGARSNQELPRIQKLYDDRLTLVRSALVQELALFDDYQQRKIEKERDGVAGAYAAFQSYAQAGEDAYGRANRAASSFLQNSEDSLVNFVMTGKLAFRDFATSIIADLARIEARKFLTGIFGTGTSSLGSIISGGIGSLFGGGKATGGQTQANKLYRVNENGPEMLTVGGKDYLMMGDRGGNVTAPSGATGGGSGVGGNTVNVGLSVNMQGTGSPAEAPLMGLGNMLSKAVTPVVQEILGREQRPGGLLWAMRNGRA